MPEAFKEKLDWAYIFNGKGLIFDKATSNF
jgi:hypothetical protein